MIRDIVLMKLNAVGLRGAAQLRISEVSGGMARRIALARAVALDPEVIMYDEPFAGLDPISMGVTANLIRRLNDTTGATSLMVSHDVQECFAIADYAYLMMPGGIVVAHGKPEELNESTDPQVRQFIRGEPDGPIKFHYPAAAVRRSAGAAAMIALRQFPRPGHACACSRRWATPPISPPTCCASCRRRCAASAWSSTRSTRSATAR